MILTKLAYYIQTNKNMGQKTPPAVDMGRRLVVYGVVAYYSPGLIASLGQTLAQVPQSMQVSGSM